MLNVREVHADLGIEDNVFLEFISGAEDEAQNRLAECSVDLQIHQVLVDLVDSEAVQKHVPMYSHGLGSDGG